MVEFWILKKILKVIYPFLILCETRLLYSVHVVIGEDIMVKAGREGGLQNMEIQGILKLRISDVDHGFIKIQVRLY